MSDYSSTFTKVTGNTVEASDFSTEFDAIETMSQTKVDETSGTLTSPTINTSVSGTAVLDEDNMASDSDTQIATQQSIKAYADTKAQNSLTSETATTSGTTVDLTSIPSWAKKVTIMWDSVSFDVSGVLIIQLGDSGGIETTGYDTLYTNEDGSSIGTSTTGFYMMGNLVASLDSTGCLTLTLQDSTNNVWMGESSAMESTLPVFMKCVGTKGLSGVLTQVRLTTTTGTPNFDAGAVSALYEG